MLIKTRKQAAQDGDSKYHTGKPCSHGHDSPRYTSSGICCKCNNEGVKKYNKSVRVSRNNRAAGVFTYKLHPDDMAAALAYCQALDIQRGRVPAAPQATKNELPAALPADIQRHRETLLAHYSQQSKESYIPKP